MATFVYFRLLQMEGLLSLFCYLFSLYQIQKKKYHRKEEFVNVQYRVDPT